jgi:hypothetical protein
MACEINASPSNGLVQSADGSGIIKLKSDGKTTNALAWVNFNGTGTVAIRSSYNVSSITDNGTGDYTVNFATALSDANYATSVSVTTPSVAQRETGSGASPATMTTSSFRFWTSNNVGGAVDCIATSVLIFGN